MVIGNWLYCHRAEISSSGHLAGSQLMLGEKNLVLSHSTL
jgi:hypothetical protein